MQDAPPGSTAPPLFRLRGRMQPMLTLELASLADMAGLERQLTARMAVAGSFFHGTPLLLDLTALPASEAGLVAGLAALVRRLGLVPAAFRARWPEVQQAALATGLGRIAETASVAQAPAPNRRPPVIVTEPVRSGQRIYAAEADLIVLSSVSRGAQLLADGCIHVYGALRGAASAGLADDPQARIFAKIMDPETIAITGLWLAADEIPEDWVGRAAQIMLAEGHLRFAPLP